MERHSTEHDNRLHPGRDELPAYPPNEWGEGLQAVPEWETVPHKLPQELPTAGELEALRGPGFVSL